MPKSQEFIDSSDSEDSKNANKTASASDEENARVLVSKKSKAKNSTSKDDVSHFEEKITCILLNIY
jgi:hypothetical protein